jgi:putative hydrolase of the HAD superfamily
MRWRAVIFDSGGTLAEPFDGSWWPKPGFVEMLTEAGLSGPSDDDVGTALSAGYPYLHEHRWCSTLDAEFDAYVGFYEIVLRKLVDHAPADLCERLAEAAVYRQDQRPYDDTVPTLNRLAAEGLRLGVVSNAGPSLELRHRHMGLRDYFDPFVISAVVGHEKPGREIYERALDQAGLNPDETVFVDDVEENVQVARDLGMTALTIDRAGAARPGTITTLADIAPLLGMEPR